MLDDLRTRTAMLWGCAGPVVGFKVLLWRDKIHLGSGRACHVFLPSRSVSAHHATLLRKDSGYLFEDAASLNGSFVNRRPTANIRLRDADIIQLADCRFMYLEGTQTPQDMNS